MEHIRNFFSGLDLSVIYVIAAAFITIIFHEVSHGYAAYLLGDRTARDRGRLSLNPLRHVDVLGLLMMIFFRFGWAKPVPVDMGSFKRPRLGMAVTALAGPVSNMILAFLAMLLRAAAVFALIKFGWGQAFVDFFGTLATLSTGIGIFNLMPIPPLDGSKILFAFLPGRWYRFVLKYERYGMLILVAVLYFGLIDGFLNAAVGTVAGAFWRAVARPLAALL